MKRFIAGLLVFLLVVAGAGYLLYPTVSNQICQRADEEVLRAYREKTALMDSGKKTELFAEAKEYNSKLGNIHIEDVFSSGQPRTSRDYQNHMNIHSGVIAELLIPGIGVSLPVYHLSTETPVGKYLVHVDGSSFPADGTGENIVLAGPGILKPEGILGDIGLTDSRMLEDLDKLKPDDLMILNVLDRTMVYRVREIQTLSSAGLKDLDLMPGEETARLTVISRRTDRRLVIGAERIPVQEARTILDGEDKVTYPDDWKNVLLLGSPVMLAGLLILWVIERFKKRAYLLPDEGRRYARREKKAKEKLEKITTETREGEGTK